MNPDIKLLDTIKFSLFNNKIFSIIFWFLRVINSDASASTPKIVNSLSIVSIFLFVVIFIDKAKFNNSLLSCILLFSLLNKAVTIWLNSLNAWYLAQNIGYLLKWGIIILYNSDSLTTPNSAVCFLVLIVILPQLK